MKREKRPSRLQWFALDVDAFLDDARMIDLDPQERGAWALILIQSFRVGGQVIVDDKRVAAATGLSKKSAGILLGKLMASGLLKWQRDNCYISPRMAQEVEIAKQAYEKRRLGGMKGMASRYGKTANSVSNSAITD